MNAPMLLTLLTFCLYLDTFCEALQELSMSVSAPTAIGRHSDSFMPRSIRSPFGQAVSVPTDESSRMTSCTPAARRRITTFLSSLCRSLFDPVLLPQTECCLSLDLKKFAFKVCYKCLCKIVVYACISQPPSLWPLDPLNLPTDMCMSRTFA